jgi:hypothetical protein
MYFAKLQADARAVRARPPAAAPTPQPAA